jgi:hypothetical protein
LEVTKKNLKSLNKKKEKLDHLTPVADNQQVTPEKTDPLTDP